MDLQVVWGTQEHREQILQIEYDAFSIDSRFSEQDLHAISGKMNALTIVAIHEHKVVGYLIKELYKNSIEVKRIAVQPELQRLGIGRFLIERTMPNAISPRKVVNAVVPEDNLNAQLFFRSMGFRCEWLIPETYEYYFTWRLPRIPDGEK